MSVFFKLSNSKILCCVLALLMLFAGSANATLYAQTVNINSGAQTTITFDPSVTRTCPGSSGGDCADSSA